jgi:hypothetical protein
MGAGGSKSSEAAGSNAGPSGSSASASACPVPEEIRSKAVYNVYNQRMDPSACPKMVRTCAWVKIVLGLENTILLVNLVTAPTAGYMRTIQCYSSCKTGHHTYLQAQ